MFKKRFFYVFGLAFILSSSSFSSMINSFSQSKQGLDFGNSGYDNTIAADNQYIGYGYNVAGGKAICDNDALYLNSPILDIDNNELMEHVRTFNSSQTTYLSYSSNKVSEIAESYGSQLSGGISANIPISAVNVNIDLKFNTNKNTSWTSTAKEEYSYYSIFAKTKPVVLQIDTPQLKKYLSENFNKDLKAVKNETEARKLFDKYGTHLLTGYTLGGIFELTNYYATNSYSYNREQSTSFNAQVGVAMASAGANIDFSFASEYSSKDNNSYAVNNYKCTTYGGYTFPGLTIDQAFSWYETAIDAGYVYDIWTDSINRGDNLVIVEVPQSSKMVPLWDLLPETENYKPTRDCLLKAYIALCGGAYKEYKNQYHDIVPTDLVDGIAIPQKDDDIETINNNYLGYNYYYPADDNENNYIVSYCSAPSDNSIPQIVPGGIVSIDYDYYDYYGHKIEWKPTESSKSFINLLDSRNGIFEARMGGNVTLKLYIDDIAFGPYVSFKISASDFAGGDGSSNNPYLIANPAQFVNLAKTKYLSANLNFKLLTDIDLSSYLTWGTIGNDSTPFAGLFDGNFKTIKNLSAKGSNLTGSTKSVGIFGVNSGTIKNVHFDNIDISNNNCGKNVHNLNPGDIKTFQFAGVVAGKNTGKIENCTVVNSGAQIRFVSETISDGDSDLKNNIYVGGIAGYSSAGGVISHCEVSSSDIYSRGDSLYVASSGGIIGYALDSTISYCSSHGNSIYSRCGHQETKDNRCAYSGGLSGRSKNTSYSNCIVFDYNGTSYESFSHSIVAQARNDNLVKIVRSCAGGLVGWVDKASDEKINSFDSCAVYDVGCLWAKTYYYKETETGSNDKLKIANEHLFMGLFVAYSDNNAINSNNVTNLFVQKCPLSFIDSDFTKTEHDLFHNPDCKTSPNWNLLSGVSQWNKSFAALSPEIQGNEYWGQNSDGNAVLMNQSIRTSNDYIIVDLEFVKTQFYVGDVFSIGDLNITCYYEIGGESFEVNDYIVDYSNFNSSLTDVAQEIYIYVFGVKVSYYVIVKEPEIIDLIATQKVEIEEEFSAGDYFNPGEYLSFFAVYENGEKVEIDPNEIIFSDLKLKEGDNAISASYHGYSISFEIMAVAKEVVSIDVDIDDEVFEYNYFVGDSNISLEGITVTVHYADGTSRILDNNEYDLIFSRICYGTNTVSLTCDYNPDNVFEFEIYGEYFCDEITINEFISIVNSINEKGTLLDKYNAIKEATILLDEIGDYRDGEDGKLTNAVEKLNRQIIEFGKTAEAINNDFFNSIILVSSANSLVLINAGVTILPLIILVIKKVLLG